MRNSIGAVLAAAILVSSPLASAKEKKVRAPTTKGALTLYSEPNFNGESYVVTKARPSLSLDFNVRSIGVMPGESWEICEKGRYKAPCMTVTESARDAGGIGVAGKIGSARASGTATPAKK